jgi:hypothetical protein
VAAIRAIRIGYSVLKSDYCPHKSVPEATTDGRRDGGVGGIRPLVERVNHETGRIILFNRIFDITRTDGRTGTILGRTRKHEILLRGWNYEAL